MRKDEASNWLASLRVLLCHLPPLPPGPDHEGVHGSLDVVHLLGAGAHPRLTSGIVFRFHLTDGLSFSG